VRRKTWRNYDGSEEEDVAKLQTVVRKKKRVSDCVETELTDQRQLSGEVRRTTTKELQLAFLPLHPIHSLQCDKSVTKLSKRKDFFSQQAEYMGAVSIHNNIF
jgi:hypothetical protein